MAVSAYLGNRMETYGKLDHGLLREDLEAGDLKATLQLSYMLVLCRKEAAIEKIRNISDPQHGLEVWRNDPNLERGCIPIRPTGLLLTVVLPRTSPETRGARLTR